MIKFKILAIKTKTDNMHAIFLLKKNVRSNTKLGYLLIAASETFKR